MIFLSSGSAAQHPVLYFHITEKYSRAMCYSSIGNWWAAEGSPGNKFSLKVGILSQRGDPIPTFINHSFSGIFDPFLPKISCKFKVKIPTFGEGGQANFNRRTPLSTCVSAGTGLVIISRQISRPTHPIPHIRSYSALGAVLRGTAQQSPGCRIPPLEQGHLNLVTRGKYDRLTQCEPGKKKHLTLHLSRSYPPLVTKLRWHFSSETGFSPIPRETHLPNDPSHHLSGPLQPLLYTSRTVSFSLLSRILSSPHNIFSLAMFALLRCRMMASRLCVEKEKWKWKM